ncbi:MAG: Phosphorylated carbohydrates phosphatase [Alphaproteobacteria bacterium ADurb.Bin438]|nr:MAG: Phosphorylated carbohydrates phosphatase [Alphaproteobacteria bacterium ADurb.Bin438]
MIKNIIFDLCGVLIDWNPRYLYRKILKDEKDIDFFLNHILTKDFENRCNMGEEPRKVILDLIKIHPEYKEAITAYDTRWQEMIGGKNSETYEILNELKGMSYKIYGLTNFPLCKFKEMDKQYTYAIPYENNLISANLKVCKPDPMIYKMMIRRFNINPRESLFIDNTLSHVDAAIKEGIRGIHYTNPEKLRDALHILKIL